MRIFTLNLAYALIPMCGSVIFGSTIAYGSATLNYIKIEFGPLSTFEVAAFQSLPAIVSIFAPHFWNFLLAKFKLKHVTCSLGLSGTVFWLLLLFMNKKFFWFAIVVRGLHGVILAGVCTVCPLYIGKLAPNDSRGLFGSLHAVGIAIGYVTFNLIGVTHKWQYPIYGSVCFLMVLGLGVWIIPNRFTKSQDDKLKKLKSKKISLKSSKKSSKIEKNRKNSFVDETSGSELTNNKLNDSEDSENERLSESVSKSLNDNSKNDEDEENEEKVDSITDKKYRKTLIISMIMMFCAQFSGTGSIIQNIAPLLSEVGLEIDAGYQASIALSAQLFMLLIGSVLMDRFGGRNLWFASSGGTALSLLFYALNIKFKWSKWIPMIALFGYQLFFGLGLASVPWYLLPENFPEHLKRTAQSLGTSMNWIAASIMMFMFPYLSEWLGQFGVMLLLMGINILVFFFGFFCVIEPDRNKNVSDNNKENDEDLKNYNDELINADTHL
ncbi:major facilitator superfamily transporter [Tritrichomonas foetus]|uniref:Major facilitator superfamily transporter n=1 Tax=Tritrichomonas foetus TaxID=1144522 RepID=A0A1J4JDJ3_9EUKA|nr:major facilitator superfamily transporter [Tritrichomonas foetus]|eukprot:OHS95324.1 major facilitator superfamily transporter [Tritrichomonas foetus]